MTADASMTHFGLIRHAETLWNRQSRIQGHRDSPLTERGKKEADGWGLELSRIPWDRIVGSDLGRAVDTAGIINHHLQIPLETDPRLREQDWGQWTALSMAKVKYEEQYKLDEAKRTGWHFCPPAGEDRLSVWQRSHQALTTATKKWPGKKILVVTHEGVIRCLIYRLCKYSYLPGEPVPIEPRHLHWLSVNENGLQIHQLNALPLP